MTTKIKAYVLLKTRNGNADSAATIVGCQPGVFMVDQVEGAADVIFAVRASSRERLAELTVQAIAAVETKTEDIQLLPVREGSKRAYARITKGTDGG